MRSYEEAMARAAIGHIDKELLQDTRPTFVFQVEGHLFDKAIVNRLTDIIVDQECDFKICNIEPGKKDEELSVALIQVWNDAGVDEVKKQISEFCAVMSKTAACVMQEREPNTSGKYDVLRGLQN